MAIPAGTKFHGVAPGVDTADLGSATVQTLRDAYTIEDFDIPLNVSTTLSASDVIALNTTAIEVVPAPGVGKSVLVLSAQMKLFFNSVPFDYPMELNLMFHRRLLVDINLVKRCLLTVPCKAYLSLITIGLWPM